MGFFMDGLDAEAYDRVYKDRQLVARIIGYFRPRLKLMLIVALLVVAGSLLDAAFPILIARSIDTLVSARAFQIALMLVGFILISGLLSWTFNLFRQWFTAQSVGDVVLQLRRDAFSAVMSRDMSFFDDFDSGKIVSRVTSDTESFAGSCYAHAQSIESVVALPAYCGRPLLQKLAPCFIGTLGYACNRDRSDGFSSCRTHIYTAFSAFACTCE